MAVPLKLDEFHPNGPFALFAESQLRAKANAAIRRRAFVYSQGSSQAKARVCAEVK